MRVFPLAATPAKLQEMVDKYLGNTCYGFEILRVKECGLVLALVSDCGNLKTLPHRQRPIFEGYGDHEISFAVPVKFFPKTPSTTSDRKYALIPFYMFVGTDWNMVTQFEEFGRIALKSRFNLPSDRWLTSVRPHQPHTVLTMSTTIFAGNSSEQQARDYDIIRISTGTRTTPPQTPRSATEVLNALGLQGYLSHEKDKPNRFYTIGLKQVRNPHNHQDADYLSLQSTVTFFVVQARQIDVESDLEMAVRLYPRFNLVEALGLCQPRAVGDDYQALTLVSPGVLTFNGIVVEDCAHDLCVCEDAENWRRNDEFNPWDLNEAWHRRHGVLQFYPEVQQ